MRLEVGGIAEALVLALRVDGWCAMWQMIGEINLQTQRG